MLSIPIERTYAHGFWGLCARLHTKPTAHTSCIYTNRLLEKPDFLHQVVGFPQYLAQGHIRVESWKHSEK
jgi:hypothetical protein